MRRARTSARAAASKRAGAPTGMSVRTRLILAFLVLSVLPLTAVTLYSYGSSVGAFRAAVASESGRMAVDLQQRLDTVTADLGRQVGRAWNGNRTTRPTITQRVPRAVTRPGWEASWVQNAAWTCLPRRRNSVSSTATSSAAPAGSNRSATSRASTSPSASADHRLTEKNRCRR